jgi:hypothetical protein
MYWYRLQIEWDYYKTQSCSTHKVHIHFVVCPTPSQICVTKCLHSYRRVVAIYILVLQWRRNNFKRRRDTTDCQEVPQRGEWRTHFQRRSLNQTCYVKLLNGARDFVVKGDNIWKYFKLFNVGQTKAVQVSWGRHIVDACDNRALG